METFQTVFEIAFPLFLIMDPFANSTTAMAILKDQPAKRQRSIILRELCIALVIMLAFQFLGEWLLNMLDIDQSTLRLAGGVILFIISLKLIFPEEHGALEAVESEPFIVPIATPLIAGPTLLAAVMLYAHREGGMLLLTGAMLLAWAATVAFMLLAVSLKDVLGEKGAKAAERLMGLILILLAVQMLEEGVEMFLQGM
jgi:multiple antibiotic resistance protein